MCADVRWNICYAYMLCCANADNADGATTTPTTSTRIYSINIIRKRCRPRKYMVMDFAPKCVCVCVRVGVFGVCFFVWVLCYGGTKGSNILINYVCSV